MILRHIFLRFFHGGKFTLMGENQVTFIVNIAGFQISAVCTHDYTIIHDHAKTAILIKVTRGRNHRIDIACHLGSIELLIRSVCTAGKEAAELGRMVDLYFADGVDHLIKLLLPGDSEHGLVQIVVDHVGLVAFEEGQIQAEQGSLYNTPNPWRIYLAGLTFEWLKSIGGVKAVEAVNIEKAKLLYGFLDNSKLFKATAQKEYRSLMNVTFVTGNEDLDKKFAKEAAAAGLKNLKGHRSVGGMRASIYNAMPYAGVEALVAFMKDFAEKNPKN